MPSHITNKENSQPIHFSRNRPEVTLVIEKDRPKTSNKMPYRSQRQDSTMNSLVSALFLVSFLFPSVAGFGARAPLQQSQRTSSTILQVLPIDATTHVDISNMAHSMWLATIDSDIADIQLEDFRRVFAGGIVSGCRIRSILNC